MMQNEGIVNNYGKIILLNQKCSENDIYAPGAALFHGKRIQRINKYLNLNNFIKRQKVVKVYL